MYMLNYKQMKKNFLLIIIVVVSMMVSTASFAQTDESNFDGTFTIIVNSMKQNDLKITDHQKTQIEENRKQEEDFELHFDDFSILIMSREKMEAELKWPKYSLLNK